jgi:glycosyltransferase involved in cell wall biosynthesis
MTARSLHIAWLGAGPTSHETGGVPGVATDLLYGLAERGHRIDCFFAGAGHPLPDRLVEQKNLTFVWGTSEWRWNRWYSRMKIAVFLSGLLSRSAASLLLRRTVNRRHQRDPYDVIYQFSNIESLAVPRKLTPPVPLVIHPETHAAGELRFLIAERRLSLRCQPAYAFAIASTTMAVRSLVQRFAIRRARLLVCISSVFRDHLVRDYRFPLEHTAVIPNPVRLTRFAGVDSARPVGEPPVVLVLGRIAARKGVEDVIAVTRLLLERDADVRFRLIGGPSLWSDYTKLLEDLPAGNSEYAGRVPPAEIPAELARSDVLLQASRYEPFGLTVAEALAAGVPVVGTSEVGAIEAVDRAVVGEVQPGDVEGIADAILAMLSKLRASPHDVRATAQSEARRLFAPEVVCEHLSDALEELVAAPRR